MKLSKLLSKVKISGGIPDIDVTQLVIDSRKVTKGCAFICIEGANADGHDYSVAAGDSGAAVIIAERPTESASPVVIVPNTKEALALMACKFYGNPSEKMKTVAITGTKGKTTVSYMISSILEAQGMNVGVIGTVGVVINGEVYKTDNTTPGALEIQKYMAKMAESGVDVCVTEASSIGLKDYRVAGINYDIGIFTNFSEDHIGGVEHRDMAEYLYSKSLLFRQCKTGVLNIDDDNFDGILKGHTCAVTTFGFSEKAQLRALESHLISKPGFLGVHFDMEGELSFGVDVAIPGKFSAYNALAAIAACNLLGAGRAAIEKGLISVKPKGRVEPVPVNGPYTMLIDYAHNAVSMQSILETLREYNPKRLICMFGAGGNRPKIRRYEMGEVSGKLADLSVITEDNSRFENVEDILSDIETGLHKTDGKYIKIPNRRDAIRYCIENAKEGDIIVLAGKGHEDYQETRGVKHHFDEREVIAEILAEREK